MNDEIKVILESLDKIAKAEYYPEDLLTYKECQLLLDYITNLQKDRDDLDDYNRYLHTELTNLQEENERLKEIEKFKFSIRKDETKIPPIVTKNYKREYEDYKSRCEKAQDLILNELSHLKASDEETWNKEFYDENNKLDYRKLCIELLNQVANLLDGGDE